MTSIFGRKLRKDLKSPEKYCKTTQKAHIFSSTSPTITFPDSPVSREC